MKRYKIKRKQADGSFVELSLDTSIDSVYRVKDGNIKSLTDILTEEYAPKDNPVFTGSISLGRKEGTTVGEGSFAVGKNLEASGEYSHAEGYETTASGDYSHAEGYSTTASGNYSHTEGDGTTASGQASHAEGAGNIASGDFSHAEGDGTTASGNYSHAEGEYTTASGTSSHAEGHRTIAQGQNQHVQGKFNINDTENKYAHIVGNGSADTKRSNAHTLDWEGNAWYAGQVEGTNLPYHISSKVLTTVPANDITNNINSDNGITVNNISINKNNMYYIEFLGIKKLCNLMAGEVTGIICSINNYRIVAFNNSTNITLMINKIDENINDVTFTDLIIHEEENKHLDSKYLEPDLILQNSISLGRVGDIGAGSSAIGYSVEASGDLSHAEGTNTIASGDLSHAEGGYTIASGESSHAEGSNTTASGIYSHAEGNSTKASGYCSHTEGIMTTASANQAHAEGTNTIASGDISHAEGGHTIASGKCQHVQGSCNIEDTENKYAHIVGNGVCDKTTNWKPIRSNAHTLDWSGNAWYAGQVEGTNLPYNISSKKLANIPANNIKLDDPITVNNVSINKDKRYYIEFLGVKKLCSLMLDVEDGNGVICSINNYKIEAYNDSTNIKMSISKLNKDDTTTDTFTDLVIYEEENKYLDSKYLETDLILQNSISLGRVGDIGTGSSAVGYMVEASGACSHAEGYNTTASGTMSHAEGEFTLASGDNSHAEGVTTIASGNYSHVEGVITIASGNYSHAEGAQTTASGDSSHAEGAQTTASGDSSHAEGAGSSASAYCSHAEGNNVTSSGDYSHAEGNFTTASGKGSHAEGNYTTASGQYQHVQGKFNIEDTANKYAHIVGNGENNNARSNAHTLDWSGNAWYAGKLSQDGTPTEDKDLTTKKYVDDKDLNTKKYVDDKVAGIVNSAPETLDTLKELSTALGDDPNFATTVATNIGSKLNKPTTEGTEGQVLSKAADGSNVWVDNGINEDDLNTMLTNTFGFTAAGN